MSSAYDKIRSALETYVASTSGIPQLAWENVGFSPTTDTPYIKVRVLNTSRRPATRGLNPHYRYQGILQLHLCYPEGVGPSASQAMVNTLIDRFPTGLDITSSDIAVTINHSEQLGSYNEGSMFKTPVYVHWFAYSQ